MSSFALKIIAVITMFIDHFGYIVYGQVSFFNYIGRLAFPIFAFQISEGYIHTKNLKNYFIRLTIFGVISQIPYMLFLSTYKENILCPNIFFTLILGLLCITVYDKFKIKNKSIMDNSSNSNYKHKCFINNLLGIFFPLIIMSLSELLNFDYGFFGVALIFIFYIFKNNKIFMNIASILAITIFYIIRIIEYPTYKYVILCMFTLIPLIFFTCCKLSFNV